MRENILFALFVCLFVGCGNLEQCYQTVDGSFECERIAEPSPLASSMPTPTPTREPIWEPIINPECNGNQLFGSGENIWKPRGENQPSLVILLDGKFQDPFSCVAELKRGGVETLRFTGFANAAPNGLRQHHRGNLPGGKYTGRIECTDSRQVCVFLHNGRTGQRKG